MSYIITYGPLGDERQEARETASETLNALETLMQRGESNIVVAAFKTGQEALHELRALAVIETVVRSSGSDGQPAETLEAL